MFISKKKYVEIIKQIPITCIDFFVVYKNSVLLGKRNNEPLKGVWFVPGGRILKLELQKEAQKRKLFEETGIKLNRSMKINLLGVYDTIFNLNAFSNKQLTHTINITYIVNLNKKINNVVRDKQNEVFKWFDMDSEYNLLDNYIKNLINDYKKKMEHMFLK